MTIMININMAFVQYTYINTYIMIYIKSKSTYGLDLGYMPYKDQC